MELITKMDILDKYFVDNAFDKFTEFKEYTAYVKVKNNVVDSTGLDPFIISTSEEITEFLIDVATLMVTANVAKEVYEEMDVIYTKVAGKNLICGIYDEYVLMHFDEINVVFSGIYNEAEYDRFYLLVSIVKDLYGKN